MSDEPTPLPDAVVDAALDQMTAETQTFIQHYVVGVTQLRDGLNEGAAALTAAERAAAFAAGCRHLAQPIRRDIERLQRGEPGPETSSQWRRRNAGPAPGAERT